MSIALAFAFVAACAFLAAGIYLLLRPGARLNDTVVGLVAVVVGAVGLMLLARPAFAADAADAAGHGVAIPPDLVATLVEYVMLALAALGAWLIRRAAAWLDLDREGKLVRRLDDGLHAALGFARERLLAAGKDLDDVRVRSELVALAANYLAPKLPDTLRALKVDPDGLRDRLTARLDLAVPRGAAPTAAGRAMAGD